jgi:glycosyltransferase involved in cell wall biosynthesis
MSRDPEPLVSICISAYNVEPFLAAALNSVLDQTYRNTEVILIDNGSTDGTYDIARTFADRVAVTRFPVNIGGYQAMNEAVKMARGDLIAVYHSDDVYHPTIVEREVAYLRAHPDAGAVFALENFMDYEGQIFGGAEMPRRFAGQEVFEYDEVFRFTLSHKNILFCCPTFMARRLTFDEVGLFDPETYEIGSDLEMWLRILRRFSVGILSERLMNYRVGRGQWSNRYNALRTEEDAFFHVMDDYLRRDDWNLKLGADDLIEYGFHRSDDDTFRAANLIIRGDLRGAGKLMRRPFPLKALTTNLRRRKVRVLLLRILINLGLALGAVRSLGRLLMWTEYRGPKYKALNH